MSDVRDGREAIYDERHCRQFRKPGQDRSPCTHNTCNCIGGKTRHEQEHNVQWFDELATPPCAGPSGPNEIFRLADPPDPSASLRVALLEPKPRPRKLRARSLPWDAVEGANSAEGRAGFMSSGTAESGMRSWRRSSC